MLKSTAGLASRSLKARLLIASFILLPMIIGVAGYALQNSFSYSLQASLEKRLRLQIYLMIGSAEMQEGKLVIGEGQQLRLGSETYGYIHTHLGLLQWESTNTDELSAKVKDSIVASRIRIGETRFLYFEENNLYLYQYPLQWDDGLMARRYLFSIVESGAQVTAELNAYRTQLWGWLFAVTVLALMLLSVITRW
jgi:two-component system sensor histidine kinase PhoQ